MIPCTGSASEAITGNGIGDVSKVTFMGGLFMDRHKFNAEIQGWDVSSVTSMDRMFLNAYNFNRDLGSWNAGNVRDMNQMFRHAVNFDQNLRDWDVSKLINAQMMFMGAEKFTNKMSGALNNTWETTESIKFYSHCLAGRKKMAQDVLICYWKRRNGG